MQKTPNITVVIPCFNSHKYLDVTLQSLEKQTVKPYEIIIVNDGSTDPVTLKYLKNLNQKKYKIINTKNNGLPAARNKGISSSTGNAILPLDSDDWLEHTALEELSKELTRSNKPVFVYSPIILRGDKKGILKNFNNRFEQLFFNKIPYSILFWKSSWKKIGGYDESMTNGYEDWDFNIRLILSNISGKMIKTPIFNYRVLNTGMLLSHSTKYHGQLWKHIISKNNNFFKLSNLIKIWLQNRSYPSNLPLYLYFIWFLFYKLTPMPVFNTTFSILKNFRSSNKREFIRKNSNM